MIVQENGRPQGGLTAVERQIADLVAHGRTNHEVAAVLWLSPKTVEWNLTKIYRKLGVRSRTELAARWATRPVERHLPNPGGTPGETASSYVGGSERTRLPESTKEEQR